MADRMAAEIWIGGKLPRSLLDEFPISDLTLDWDETRFDASSEQGILSARDENGLLHFADCEIAWGEFQPLEDWLREHDIPFRRHSEGKYEHAPELVEFRPDLQGKRNQNVYTLTTPEGAAVVSVAEIEQVAERMAKLAAGRKRLPAKRLEAWERLFHALLRRLPPKLAAATALRDR